MFFPHVTVASFFTTVATADILGRSKDNEGKFDVLTADGDVISQVVAFSAGSDRSKDEDARESSSTNHLFSAMSDDNQKFSVMHNYPIMNAAFTEDTSNSNLLVNTNLGGVDVGLVSRKAQRSRIVHRETKKYKSSKEAKTGKKKKNKNNSSVSRKQIKTCTYNEPCSDSILSFSKYTVVCQDLGSCYNSSINLIDSTIVCEGIGSCLHTKIEADETSVVNCVGLLGCNQAKINNAQKVYCTGERSCYASNITLNPIGKLYYNSDNKINTLAFSQKPLTVQPNCSNVEFDCCWKYKLVEDFNGRTCLDYYDIKLIENEADEIVSYYNCPLGQEVQCGLSSVS